MSDQEERVVEMIKLYQLLNPNETITRHTKIKNTSIEKLCATNGGPYQRVVSWMYKKLDAPTEPKEKVDDFQSVLRECYDLMKDRNTKYGNSWMCLSVQSIANLIEMKMNRVAKLGPAAPKTEDEFIDTINYAVFGLLKLRNPNINETELYNTNCLHREVREQRGLPLSSEPSV